MPNEAPTMRLVMIWSSSSAVTFFSPPSTRAPEAQAALALTLGRAT
jgi:hypothetical protein